MRRQLAVLVAAITALVVIAFLVPLALLVRELAEDRAVRAGTQDAQNTALLVGVLGPGARLETAVDLSNQRSSRRTTIFLSDGSVIGAPARRSGSVDRAEAGLASSAETAAGYEILQPVATPEGRQVVRVLVPEEELRSGVQQAWLLLAGLGVALLLVAIAVADQLARRVTRPLGDLTQATHRLGEGDLQVRVDPHGPPEVTELAGVVNRLANRIQNLLAAEREQVADLSHRLRTPITALRLDTEGLRDAEESRRLSADVDALERAVDDVIVQARRPIEEHQTADAVDVVRSRVSFWSALAEDQGRVLHLNTPDAPAMVAVSAPDLAAALDALVENALSYTPEGVGIYVWLETRPGGGAVLAVEDEGPGFDVGQSPARGQSSEGSTGLGLDIARRTAEASGGRMSIGSRRGGGASVQIELGPPSL
jgi:signal transduction histidine kinase